MIASATDHKAELPPIYTCPMHPQIRQAAPGSCSICGMALTTDAAGTNTRMSATPGTSTFRPLAMGAIATLAMLGVYFSVLSLVSGWDFTISEFLRFWPYIIALTLGFGMQIGLYFHLRQLLLHHHAGGTMVAASGATSTAAMLACCTHYLANVLPIIGAAGLVTLAAQYQVEFFWVGLAFNAAGIAFVGSKIIQARRQA